MLRLLFVLAFLASFSAPLFATSLAHADSLDDSIAKYAQAKSEEDKETTRSEIKKLFYASKSDEEKDKIRDFFRKNPSTGGGGESAGGARRPASTR